MPFFQKRYREVIKQVLEKLRLHMYTPVAPLKTVCYRTAEPVPFEARQSGEYLELNIGDEWGKQFDCAWFHFTGKIPESCAGEKVVVAIDVNGEGLIFDDEGVPVRGITCISYALDNKKGTGSKRIYIISEKAEGGEAVDMRNSPLSFAVKGIIPVKSWTKYGKKYFFISSTTLFPALP